MDKEEEHEEEGDNRGEKEKNGTGKESKKFRDDTKKGEQGRITRNARGKVGGRNRAGR